jgi:hypothetical protein
MTSPSSFFPLPRFPTRSQTFSRSSGPVLFTLTLDGRFRIWGSMIDEPSFFSLWATLDVSLPASLPRHVPLTTLYWRTTPMAGRKEETGGMEDAFVTVFADGSVGLTTVSVRFHFSPAPPSLLTDAVPRRTSTLVLRLASPNRLPSLPNPFSRRLSSPLFDSLTSCHPAPPPTPLFTSLAVPPDHPSFAFDYHIRAGKLSNQHALRRLASSDQ